MVSGAVAQLCHDGKLVCVALPNLQKGGKQLLCLADIRILQVKLGLQQHGIGIFRVAVKHLGKHVFRPLILP